MTDVVLSTLLHNWNTDACSKYKQLNIKHVINFNSRRDKHHVAVQHARNTIIIYRDKKKKKEKKPTLFRQTTECPNVVTLLLRRNTAACVQVRVVCIHSLPIWLVQLANWLTNYAYAYLCSLYAHTCDSTDTPPRRHNASHIRTPNNLRVVELLTFATETVEKVFAFKFQCIIHII